ncbi:MAG: glycosyltransferase family 39 protein [Acidobacteria bacterium]|nr:glycosyltransferase family 39 protein [Acidobacteriota bacterium]
MISGSPDRARRCTRLEAAFTLLFVLVAAVSWVGMLLAEAGAFTLGRLLAGAGVLAAVVWVWIGREPGTGRPSEPARPVAAHVWLAILLAAAAALYGRPGEYLIEGRDASVYLAIGQSIHRTGGMVSPDEVLRLLPDEARDALLKRDGSWPQLLNRFPGGLQVGTGDLVVPNFFHLLPVWIAVFVGLFGPHGGYYVNAVFGVLGVLAAWLVGRRAWSASAAGIAATLLAVNFGQVWYAWTASSEMLAQWFLLAGIFFTLVARDNQSRCAGACAGAAIGLAGMVRIDALIVLLPLGIAWLVLARRRRLLGPAWPWYAATIGLLGVHAIAHALLVSTPYTLRLAAMAFNAVARVIAPLGGMPALGLAAAALVGTWVFVRLLPSPARLPVLAGLAILAPAVASPGVVRTASLLLTPAGAAVMLAAFIWVVSKDGDLRLLPLIAPFAAEMILWLAWREKTAWPADFRRFVPAVLPLGFLFVGALAARVAAIGVWARRIAWIVVASLAAVWLGQAWPALRLPPMQGVHAEVGQIADRIPPSAIVIADRSTPSHLPLALQATFDRAVLPVMERVPPGGALQAFIARALAAKRRVFVILTDYPGDPPRRLWRSDFGGLSVTFSGGASLAYTVLESSSVAFPRRLQTVNTAVDLYEIESADAARAVALPFTADFGDRDFAFVLRGFYGGESMPSARARWTAGEAQIALPRVAIARPEATLVVRLAAARSPGVRAPTVRIDIDGTEVGIIDGPGPGFSEYRFALNAAVVARLAARDSVLTIRTDTFVPKATSPSSDARVLGVALDWIRLE